MQVTLTISSAGAPVVPTTQFAKKLEVPAAPTVQRLAENPWFPPKHFGLDPNGCRIVPVYVPVDPRATVAQEEDCSLIVHGVVLQTVPPVSNLKYSILNALLLLLVTLPTS